MWQTGRLRERGFCLMGLERNCASGARAESAAEARRRPTLLTVGNRAARASAYPARVSLKTAELYELAPAPPSPAEHDRAEREREHVDGELDCDGARIGRAVDAVLEVEQHVQ